MGQCKENLFHPIYDMSKTLNDAQRNYNITNQELLVVGNAFEKFCAYFLGIRAVVHTNHVTFNYLMEKKKAKHT